jgi:hypothetical protein
MQRKTRRLLRNMRTMPVLRDYSQQTGPERNELLRCWDVPRPVFSAGSVAVRFHELDWANA